MEVRRKMADDWYEDWKDLWYGSDDEEIIEVEEIAE
jgi:hypothetical protein